MRGVGLVSSLLKTDYPPDFYRNLIKIDRRACIVGRIARTKWAVGDALRQYCCIVIFKLKHIGLRYWFSPVKILPYNSIVRVLKGQRVTVNRNGGCENSSNVRSERKIGSERKSPKYNMCIFGGYKLCNNTRGRAKKEVGGRSAAEKPIQQPSPPSCHYRFRQEEEGRKEENRWMDGGVDDKRDRCRLRGGLSGGRGREGGGEEEGKRKR